MRVIFLLAFSIVLKTTPTCANHVLWYSIYSVPGRDHELLKKPVTEIGLRSWMKAIRRDEVLYAIGIDKTGRVSACSWNLESGISHPLNESSDSSYERSTPVELRCDWRSDYIAIVYDRDCSDSVITAKESVLEVFDPGSPGKDPVLRRIVAEQAVLKLGPSRACPYCRQAPRAREKECDPATISRAFLSTGGGVNTAFHDSDAPFYVVIEEYLAKRRRNGCSVPFRLGMRKLYAVSPHKGQLLLVGDITDQSERILNPFQSR